METLGTDYDRDTTGWMLTFGKFRDGKGADELLDLYPGEYRQVEHFGDTTYTVYSFRPRNELPDSTARKFVGSPEGLRDFGLDWIKAVRANSVAAIQGGPGQHLYATRRNRNLPRVNPGPIPVPYSPTEPSDRPLTDEEKQIAIRHLDEEMDRREHVLSANFREMHAAILEAFPWQECLKAKAKR